MIIGKTFKFESSHNIIGHPKCGQLHGHTYHLTVEVEGSIDEKTDMVMDYHEMSEIVNRLVINKYDHTHLNMILPCQPTCERLVFVIFHTLMAEMPRLASITLQEGEGGYAKLTRQD